jgi:hypothetical protein
MTARMKRVAVLSFVAGLLLSASDARSQEPPPKIGPFVVDFHASVPRFPSDPKLAESRGVQQAELPGRGLGMQVGVTVYPLRWRAVTFGVGGELARSRSRRTPPTATTGSGTARAPTLRATEEKFTSLAPQLSFNFGHGHGWSYVSGGLARSTWSLVPSDRLAFPSDAEKLKTINYGGGARWFIKPHVAFSFDVRFYAINPGAPYLDFPGSPRTTLMVIGAGVSVK